MIALFNSMPSIKIESQMLRQLNVLHIFTMYWLGSFLKQFVKIFQPSAGLYEQVFLHIALWKGVIRQCYWE